jgi:hypothetical protein
LPRIASAASAGDALASQARIACIDIRSRGIAPLSISVLPIAR